MAEYVSDMLTPILFDLLEHARVAMNSEDHPADPPKRVLLMPGANVVHDDCCEGQLWVRVIETTPHTGRTSSGTSGRSGQAQWARCGINYWVSSIGMGIVRCAATVDSRGNAPTPEAMTADTALQNFDAEILAGVLACYPNVSLTRWNPSGPQGGCVGGEWTAQLRYGI